MGSLRVTRKEMLACSGEMAVGRAAASMGRLGPQLLRSRLMVRRNRRGRSIFFIVG